MRYLFSILLLFVFTNISRCERILYEFDATWCGPCKILTKAIEEDQEAKVLIEKYRGFVKVDVDKFPKLAKRWNISTIPQFCIVEITDTDEGTRAVVVDRWTPKEGEDHIESLKKFLFGKLKKKD